MKTRRFFSLFFLLVLTVRLSLVPAAAAEEDGGVSPPGAPLRGHAAGGRQHRQTVYGKNEHQEMYPASLTKIMTALLVLEAVDDGQLSLDQQSPPRRAPWRAWRRTAAPPASRPGRP